VGIDELAAALIGPAEKVELPKPGHWIRQGQKAWSFLKAGEKTEMVSPIEGEVVEINQEVAADPTLVRKDPYGQGWLFSVYAPDEESTFRNLLPVHMVAAWMRDAVERVYNAQPRLAGHAMADGGRPAEDLSTVLPKEVWKELTTDLFLTR
jgi:glycine cleavage system H lipoate-binding protein